MKPSRAILGAILLLSSAVYAATRPAPRQDVIKVAGDSHTVIFENDRVRVLSVHFKPGQIAPMHAHPENVSYFLTDGKLKITLPDGKVIERSPKAGTAGWSDAVTHTAENIGTTDFQQIQIELKPQTPKVVPTN
jgi:oxalate decarboxylase/phosphoglucose isomerase-like protein (cupin superfamily)